MSKNLYIVPYDFTPVSRKALDYALYLGEKVQTEIKLLHLAADKAQGMSMVTKMEELKKSITPPPGTELTSLVKVGSIFTDIGKIAEEEKAQLIIMGTHGMRGLQGLFGSHAMKVITSADCPFLVVQKNTKIEPIKNIGVPVDLTKESLQIVSIAGDLASIFKAKVNVIAERQTDAILNTRLKNRLSIVMKEYEDRNVDAQVEFVKKSGNYAKKVMNVVEEKSMDLISIAYHSESLLPQLDKFAQNLITNKQAKPVLIVNSKLASALYF